MQSKVLMGSLLAFSSVLALSAPAAAQDAEGTNAEQKDDANQGVIIVTAQRREQALQQVPLSITAVTAQQLEDRNIRGLADFANGSVPGIQIVPFTGASSILAINARGIGISDPTQGTQELAVPLYIDGVPLGRAQGLGLELIDPERVEFLRGPQGTLFGRNAQGGAVQFVSRRPSGELEIDARAQLGNYGLNSQRLRVDLPEFANIKLQGTISRTERNGFTRNSDVIVYDQQRDFNELESLGFRIAAEWNPSDSFRLNYTYDNADIDDTQGYLTWVPVNINGRPPFSPQPAFNGEFPDRVNSPVFNEGFETRAKGHALTMQYTASENVTLKSISSYRETSRNGSGSLGDALVAGGSSTGILRTNAREDVEQEQFYQELQFLGSWNNLDLTLGATYFHESVDDRRRSRIEGPGLRAPALGLSPAALFQCIGRELCTTARSEQNATTDSFGVYGQVTYTPPILDEKLEISVGARYSNDKKTAIRTYIQPRALPPFDNAPSGPLPPPAVFEASRIDPAVVVKYNFTDDVNMYLRYATGYRAGGANVRSSFFTSYDEEEVEAFEIGFKGQFLDRRVNLNIALYQNNIDGLQNTIQEDPFFNPSLTNTVNDSQTFKVRGAEVELSVRIVDPLRLSFGYSYMDAGEFREFGNPLAPGLPLTRFYAIQTPEHSGNVALDFDKDLSWSRLRARLDYAFASDFHTTPGGLLVASLGPSYRRPTAETSVLNGRIAFSDINIGEGRIEVALFGRNLADETNFVYAFDGAAAGGGFGQFIQEPRQFGLELRFQY